MPTRPVLLSLAFAGLFLLAAPFAHAQQPAQAPKPPTTSGMTLRSNDTNASSQIVVDPYSAAVATAIKMMNANNVEGALTKLNEAIKINPNIAGAYALRGSIYYQKKQWDQAMQDFQTASNLDPKNAVLKLNAIEIKFLQKQYDAARPAYLALKSDPEMGDFAAYKVFLCDLFGGHEAEAAKELAVFNDAAANPSYFFGNAAWDLYHKKIDDARGWLISASRIYPANKFAYYAQSLRDLGYLPIPPPANK